MIKLLQRSGYLFAHITKKHLSYSHSERIAKVFISIYKAT